MLILHSQEHWQYNKATWLDRIAGVVFPPQQALSKSSSVTPQKIELGVDGSCSFIIGSIAV